MTIQIVETKDVADVSPDGMAVTPMRLIDTDDVHALLLCLAAGQSVAPCQMSSPVLYYVIEGQGRLRVGDEEAELKTGSLAVVPADAVRTISAADPIRVLAVQVL